jgi:putative flippase GtrA
VEALTKCSFVYLVSCCMNVGLLYILLRLFNFGKIDGQLLTIVIITIINFKLVKSLVFK